MEFENGVANFLRIKKETLKKDEKTCCSKYLKY